MAARKFKFVSPGVFLKEVDNSQLPKLPGNIGPVIIGRTRKGPALNPVKVNSYADFVEMFGEPIPGNQGEDVWREGNGLLAPAYANYAAKAYFAADIASPVTVIRLLGAKGDNASSVTNAEPGWATNNAFALVVYPAAAAGEAGNLIDVAKHQVAAIFYLPLTGTTVHLGGKDGRNVGTVADSTAGQVVRTDADGNFNIRIKNGTTVKSVFANFTKGSKNHIREVLNTNPVATNSLISYTTAGTLSDKYWLGETFEEKVPTFSGVNLNGYLIQLTDSSAYKFSDRPHEATAATSGWVFHQRQGDVATYDSLKMDKLFRFIALAEGEEISKNIVVAVEDIRIPQEGDTDPYGSFSIVVKKVHGTSLEVIESYVGCNLNPNSENYVARQVGDQFFKWSKSEKRNKVYGNYVNKSNYIRMEMDSNVDNGSVEPSKVPFGFRGPIVPIDAPSGASNSAGVATIGADSRFIKSGQSITTTDTANNTKIAKIAWPALETTVSGSVRGDDYFGASVYKVGSTGVLSNELDKGMIDYVRALPSGYNTTAYKAGDLTADTQYAFTFSLDEIKILGENLATPATANVQQVFHLSGSGKVAGTGPAAQVSYTSDTATSTSGAANLLELGFDKFQMPLVGGFDGVNITEADPFANRVLKATANTADNYAYASVDRAIELIRDPEAIEHNVAVAPGLTERSLVRKLVQTCESRADSLAIVDLPDVYLPPHEKKCKYFDERIVTDPESAAKDLKKEQLNSSYGAAYYPWVKIRDAENTRDIWVPPSVVALGVMAYTEQRDEVWFAPAGFNRGGLNEGNAGVPVLQVSEQLLSKQRDALYDANINPIASFVTEGLVIFGQKTLQTTPSALDRINVRRLLIFVKKEISRIASGLLFDQNVPATWNRFLGQVNPFLQSVQTRLGLSDYKVILDNSTTTPDLIDRNVMYAKIFLKPARSIEFIAVDFVITNTGASFDD
jgi:hypothetical protein